jgi:hypothetical protein
MLILLRHTSDTVLNARSKDSHIKLGQLRGGTPSSSVAYFQNARVTCLKNHEAIGMTISN